MDSRSSTNARSQSIRHADEARRCCSNTESHHNYRIYRRANGCANGWVKVNAHTPFHIDFNIFLFSFFFPLPNIYVILVRNILGSVGAQILPDIYTHLFPGGCLLSVLAATRYRLEADVTVKIEKQLLLLLLLLSCSEWGKGRRSGERDLSVPWACGSDVWTGSIINGVSRNFWFHGHSGIFTLLGIVPLLMTRDSELELYFCDGLISEIAPSVWVWYLFFPLFFFSSKRILTRSLSRATLYCYCFSLCIFKTVYRTPARYFTKLF